MNKQLRAELLAEQFRSPLPDIEKERPLTPAEYSQRRRILLGKDEKDNK